MMKIFSTTIAIIAVALAIAAAALTMQRKNAAPRPAADTDAKSAPITFSAERNGFHIKSGASEIANMSSVIVCVPPFREKHFYNVTDPVEFISEPDTAKIVQKGDQSKVKINDYSVTRSGDSVILSLAADLIHADPTDLENTLLVAPEYLLSNSTWEAVSMDGKTDFGKIGPVFEGEPRVVHVMENARKATFKNAYGTLTLEVLDGPGFTVGDRRGVPFEERRCFWIGHQTAMEQGRPYNSKVKLGYQPAPGTEPVAPIPPSGEKTVVTAQEGVVTPYSIEYPLVPVPKAAEFFKDRSFDPSHGVQVVMNVKSPRLDKAVEKLLAPIPAVLMLEPGEMRKLRIEIGEKGEGILIPPENPEGYLLSVEEREIKIFSRTERGAFYALQTLRSLYRDRRFTGALIRDWPDMEMRAVHFMLPDRDAYSLLSRIVTEVMVPMKMNTFIMECEFVHWESIPELHVKWGLSKADCEKLIALCEENYIDPIPLLQTLSHMPWMFANGQNLDMCEDTSNPYCYFTGHPGVYPLMTRVLDEVMTTFHNPRYLHIGHDELYTWAKFPNRPESVAKGAPKIVLDDVMWYYEYAKKHNAKIMMWHDIFVTKAESPENGHGGGDPDWVDTIRPDLPRDIVFCVWRYAGKTLEFLDLEHLAAEGFEVAGSSWFEVNNVERLTRATKKVGGLGMISTTWIYPDIDAKDSSIIKSGMFDALEKWFIQLAPYTRSGAWSWNCDGAGTDFDGKELFADLLEPSRNDGAHDGLLVDLAAAANTEMTAKARPFMIDDLYGFDTLPTGDVRVGRVMFKLGRGAVALKSRLNPLFPVETTIDLGGVKCRKLYFLNTAIGIQPDPKEPVAEYVLNYADGTSAALPVRYQFEVAPPEEEVNYLLSTGNRLAWKHNGGKMSMWYCTFVNPEQEKAIASVTVKAVEKEFPFYLFGLTMED